MFAGLFQEIYKDQTERNERVYSLQSTGADYYERFIIYRIEHKDPGFIRHPHFKYYDLNEKKFQNQIGLRNWAIHQNIALSFEQAKALDEIRNLTTKQSLHDQLDNLYEQSGNLQKEISILDAEIYHLQNNVLTAILEYPRYYAALIKPYKQLPKYKTIYNRKQPFIYSISLLMINSLDTKTENSKCT